MSEPLPLGLLSVTPVVDRGWLGPNKPNKHKGVHCGREHTGAQNPGSLVEYALPLLLVRTEYSCRLL